MVIPSKNEVEETLDEPSGNYERVDNEENSASSLNVNAGKEVRGVGTSGTSDEKISDESDLLKNRIIPPPGLGQRIYEIDPMLNSHRGHLDYR